ncbi:serine/threonine-protein phosphatase [Leptospira idonii]|uniref:Serine/threonine-protein phosphatase n=2 Tax=Leptospira idonii TaxID=1193500 RepID=A0A4R9M0Z3_9LEPT|nr:serine/threonine-protein phosphatase [Leptospira idonii]
MGIVMVFVNRAEEKEKSRFETIRPQTFLGLLIFSVIILLVFFFFHLTIFFNSEFKQEENLVHLQFLSFALILFLSYLSYYSSHYFYDRKKQEETNSILLHGTFDIIFWLNEEGSLLAKNDQAKKWMKGLKSSGSSILSLLDPEVAESILEKLQEGLAEEEIIKWESQIDYGGVVFFYEIYLHRSHGQIFLSLKNITDRKKAEIALLDSYKTIAEDLEIARETQKIIMSSPLPKKEFVHVESFYKPYMSVSGDIIGSYSKDKDSYHFIFGDVTGHGTASGMISCAVALAFQTTVREELSPAAGLQSLHKILKSITHAHLLSAVYLSISKSDKRLKYSYAGHHSCYVIRNGQFIELEGKGHPLLSIIEPETFDYEFILEKGDRLFLFSDGLFEILDRSGNILGQKAFIQYVSPLANLRSDLFLNKVWEKILIELNGKQLDDMSMLLLEISE